MIFTTNKLIINDPTVKGLKGNNGVPGEPGVKGDPGEPGEQGPAGISVVIPQLHITYKGTLEPQERRNASITEITAEGNKFGMVYAYWNNCFNEAFLTYNPRIRLKRYKRRAKKGSKKRRYFSMPTHLNGRNDLGSNVNGGTQNFSTHQRLPDRITKWECPEKPFQKMPLTGLNPLVWFGSLETIGENLFPVPVATWHDMHTMAEHNMTGQGKMGHYGNKRKKLVFKFCIVIDNPNDPTKQIEGPESEILIIMPKKGYFEGVKPDIPFYYAWHAKIR